MKSGTDNDSVRVNVVGRANSIGVEHIDDGWLVGAGNRKMRFMFFGCTALNVKLSHSDKAHSTMISHE